MLYLSIPRFQIAVNNEVKCVAKVLYEGRFADPSRTVQVEGQRLYVQRALKRRPTCSLACVALFVLQGNRPLRQFAPARKVNIRTYRLRKINLSKLENFSTLFSTRLPCIPPKNTCRKGLCLQNVPSSGEKTSRTGPLCRRTCSLSGSASPPPSMSGPGSSAASQSEPRTHPPCHL